MHNTSEKMPGAAPEACQYMKVTLANIFHDADPDYPAPEVPTEPCTWVKDGQACGAVILLKERQSVDADDSDTKMRPEEQDAEHPCLYLHSVEEGVEVGDRRLLDRLANPDPSEK